jgi:uncharacterized protein DUF1206
MKARHDFEMLARMGYAARGAVYLLVGMLALFSGFAGGGNASPNGALASLLGQPFGQFLLALITLGLLGFVLWRLTQALANADHREGNAKGYLIRAGQLVSAVAYGTLAITAAQLAIGSGGAQGNNKKEGLVAWLMALPFGNILAGGVGLVIIGVGIGQIYRGISGKFEKRLSLPPEREKVLRPIGTYGLAAHGLIFAIIGGFLLFAAFTLDPNKVGSMPEALDWVRGLPFGGVLYVLVAVGLLAYAGYGLIQAVYGKVHAPSAHEIKQVAAGT